MVMWVVMPDFSEYYIASIFKVKVRNQAELAA
jgi:hypothetical protein